MPPQTSYQVYPASDGIGNEDGEKDTAPVILGRSTTSTTISSSTDEDDGAGAPLLPKPPDGPDPDANDELLDSSAVDARRPKSRRARSQSVGMLEAFSLRYHLHVIWDQALSLVKLLVHGTPKWFVKLVRLVLFVTSVFPAFTVFFWHYFSCDRISVPYKMKDEEEGGRRCGGCLNGRNRPAAATSRNFLDVYGAGTTPAGPPRSGKTGIAKEDGKPVVVFLTGGAWIIGYKMWGALLARALVPAGVLVIIPDYRNFPQTSIDGMMDDVDAAVQWTVDNCRTYGGDPTRIVLVGQSAGAHIGSCLLLKKAKTSLLSPPPAPSALDTSDAGDSRDGHEFRYPWTPKDDLRGFACISSPNNLVVMAEVLHRHGLDRSIVSAMFCSEVPAYSPTHVARGLRELLSKKRMNSDDDRQHKGAPEKHCERQARDVMPPVAVMHGKVDKTVPYEISVEFAESLKDLGIDVNTTLYDGWSHTDPILEAPFVGDHRLHRDIYDLVELWTAMPRTESDGTRGDGDACVNGDGSDIDTARVGAFLECGFDESSPSCRKICPEFLVQLARFFNPF